MANYHMLTHSVQTGLTFQKFLGDKMELGKLYPLCKNDVSAPDVFRKLVNLYPTYYSFYGQNIVLFILLQRAIEQYYADPAVRFVTHLKRAMRDNGLQTIFDDAPNGAKAMMQKISEVFAGLVTESTLWVEAYNGPVNWDRGDFGNPKSCFWSERPAARHILNAMFASGEGGAFRIYSSSGGGKPWRGDPENLFGYGRLWAMVWKSSLLLFNPYPQHNLFETYAKGLAELLGTKTSETLAMETDNVSPSDDGEPEEDAENILYINRDEGRLLLGDEDDLRHGSRVRHYVTFGVNQNQRCSRCGGHVHLDSMVFCQERQNWVCHFCCRHKCLSRDTCSQVGEERTNL